MNRTDSQLVLRDVPVLMWIFGLIFAGVGGLILYEGSGRAPILGLVFLVVGLGALFFMSLLTITADRTTRTLTLDYRSVFLHKVKQVPFDEISGISVERSVSHNKGRVSYTYRVILKKKDGQIVPFRSSSSSGAAMKERQANALCEFIGVQAFDSSPVGMFYSALNWRPDEVHETNGVHWQVQPMVKATGIGARWYSPDFKTPGRFLLVGQKAEGQSSQGFMASLGTMIFKQTLSLFGFQPDDTPGLDDAVTLTPLDPALEPHYTAFTNVPATAPQMLNSAVTAQLAEWARRYPLKQFQKMSGFGQLVVLFGPKGVYLETLSLPKPEQVHELAAFGAELVNAQNARAAGAV